jgi:hypothetical protein
VNQQDRFINAFLVFSIFVFVGALIYSGCVFYQLRKPLETEPEVPAASSSSVEDTDGVHQPVADSESDLTPIESPQGPDDTSAESVDTAVQSPTVTNGTEDESLFAEPDEKSLSAETRDFPEIPEGFPSGLKPVWLYPDYQKGDMHEHEMIYRVLIKLWNQGDHDFVNGIYDHDHKKVYPLYPDVMYVEWGVEDIGGKNSNDKKWRRNSAENFYTPRFYQRNLENEISRCQTG